LGSRHSPSACHIFEGWLRTKTPFVMNTLRPFAAEATHAFLPTVTIERPCFGPNLAFDAQSLRSVNAMLNRCARHRTVKLTQVINSFPIRQRAPAISSWSPPDQTWSVSVRLAAEECRNIELILLAMIIHRSLPAMGVEPGRILPFG